MDTLREETKDPGLQLDPKTHIIAGAQNMGTQLEVHTHTFPHKLLWCFIAATEKNKTQPSYRRREAGLIILVLFGTTFEEIYSFK